MCVWFEGKCPSPLKNRDFVTMRSWLPLGNDYLIINYSVKHPVSITVIFTSVCESLLSRWDVKEMVNLSHLPRQRF